MYQQSQIGFVGKDGRLAQHGVRYFISPPPASSPYRISMWIPESTSDLDSGWGGSEMWVRGQGMAVTKAIWYQKYFYYPDIEISRSGMTDPEKDDIRVWLDERAERLRQQRNIAKIKYEKHGEGNMTIYEPSTRKACRADCGEENPKLVCSKCKIARYCGVACQKEDWKVILTSFLSVLIHI